MSTLRYVWRRLARRATGSLLVVTSLGLAVGGAGALLSVFNALVLRSMRVPEADRLVAVYPANGNALYGVPTRTLEELARRQTAFDGVCGISSVAVSIGRGAEVTAHEAEAVSGTCYALLGLHPFLGRLIDSHDAPVRGDSASVVVVSYAFWANTLARDPQTVGRVLSVNGHPLTVIGVTPAGVGGFDADQAPDLVVPLGMVGTLLGAPADYALRMIGRLRSDRTLADATADMRTIWPAAWTTTNPILPGRPASRAASIDALRVESIARGTSRMRDQYGDPVLFLLLLAVLLVTLACVNVGGFLLARVTARERELAVLTALGADRRRLMVDVALEGWIVGLGAGAVALPVAWAISRFFVRLTWTGTLPSSLQTTPDAWVYAAMVGAAALVGFVISVPSIAYVRLSRSTVAGNLRTLTFTSSTWRRVLLAGQVSLSVGVVFAAGLFARNLASLRQLNPGYAPADLVWTRLDLAAGQPRQIDQVAYYRPLLEKLSAIPGVTGVALASAFPTRQLYQVVGLSPYRRADADPGTGEVGGTFDVIGPGFFANVGVPLEAGREFDWSDTVNQPVVVILNHALAEKLFPKHDALGARLQVSPTLQATIVGVVPNTSIGDFRLRDLPAVYTPLLQGANTSATVTVRVTGAASPTDAIKAVIEAAGRHHVPWFRTVESEMNLFWLREQALAAVATAFGAVSLLIGALGLYALLDYSVGTRQRELGVRRALGASAGHLLRIIGRESALLAASGAAVGIPLALVLGHAAQALLSGLSPYDWPSLQIALVALGTTVLLATARPALRAAQTRPNDALRAE